MTQAPSARQLLDGVELGQENLVVDGHGERPAPAHAVIAHGKGIQQAVGRHLVIIFNHVPGNAALLRRQLQQLLVVEGDAQLIRQLFADFAAAAAELPPDGDNGAIMHKKPVLSPGSLPFLASSILRFSRFVYRFIKKFTKKSIKQAPLLCKDNSGA